MPPAQAVCGRARGMRGGSIMATIIRVNGTFEPLAGAGPDGVLTAEQVRAVVGGDFAQISFSDYEGYPLEMGTLGYLATHRIYVRDESGQEALPINHWANRLMGIERDERGHPIFGLFGDAV